MLNFKTNGMYKLRLIVDIFDENDRSVKPKDSALFVEIPMNIADPSEVTPLHYNTIAFTIGAVVTGPLKRKPSIKHLFPISPFSILKEPDAVPSLIDEKDYYDHAIGRLQYEISSIEGRPVKKS